MNEKYTRILQETKKRFYNFHVEKEKLEIKKKEILAKCKKKEEQKHL